MGVQRARTHFAVGRRIVRPGDLVDSSDPVIKGREHLFNDVEQATAAPGEARGKVRTHVCDVCGQEAKTKAGLATHKRTHSDDE